MAVKTDSKSKKFMTYGFPEIIETSSAHRNEINCS